MKPTAVPSSASRRSDSGDEPAELFPASQLVRQAAQQQRLVEFASRLSARLRHQVRDVPRQDARWKGTSIEAHHVAVENAQAGVAFDRLRDLARRLQLPGDDRRLDEAVRRRQNEDGDDQGRDMASVRLEQRARKAEIGQRQGAECDHADHDQQTQKRPPVADLVEVGQNACLPRSTAHRRPVTQRGRQIVRVRSIAALASSSASGADIVMDSNCRRPPPGHCRSRTRRGSPSPYL